MSDDTASDKVSELFYDGLAKLDYRDLEYDIETDQPAHAAWIVLDTSFEEYGTDAYTIIEYSNAKAMQAELLRLIKAVFTPELLEFVRTGEVKDLTLRIGPHALSGEDLNEENSIEVEHG